MWTSTFASIVLLLLVSPASGQVVRTGGPPPEIRALFDAFVAGVNGGAEDFEAFAQKHFSPDHLNRQSRIQRAALHRRIVDRFGTIAIGRVMREGPDAPLQMGIKGSKAEGTISVSLEPNAPRIDDILIPAPEPEPSARASDGPPVNASMTSPEIDKALDGYFSGLAAAGQFSGVALVARNGVPAFFKAYGLANRERNIPNTIRTRFNLGSINKAFTQVAIHQLVAAGTLSYSDTLGNFYPDYPQAATRAATIEQLLSHRAGVSDFFGAAFNNAPKSKFASNADYFAFVGSLPPTFAPGEREQYCNGCYIALGAIVEKASGMPYEKYVADQVFARAEMTSTGYPRSDQPADDIAQGYTRRAGGSLQASGPSSPQALVNNVAMHGVTGSAAGGGYSTALDLLTYVKAVKAGRFPGVNPDIGIAGGAPGINAIVEVRGEWTVIVLSNFDPPSAQSVGIAIADALER